MGLDTTHDCWHGAYSAFTRWRSMVLEASGLPTVTVPRFEHWDEGRSGPCPTDTYVDVPEEYWTPKYLNGDWDECPDEPLLILLCHYDCEGRIQHEHTYALAKALEDLLPWFEDKVEHGHLTDPYAKTQRFITGLMLAWEQGEDVEFQ